MSSITTTISVQIDKKDKEEVTKILDKLGVTMSGLINMTIKQVIMKEGIPFEVTIPKEPDDLSKYFTKEELENTYKELILMEKNLNDYKSYNNINDLKKDLLNDNELSN